MDKVFASLRKYWFLIVASATLTFAVAQADTTINEHTSKLLKLEQVPVALAHIETSIDDQNRRLDRIEKKLDEK